MSGSEEEGAFVWGGGDGAGDGDFTNPALGGEDGVDDGSFVWGGGGGDDDDDSNSDEEDSNRGSDDGGAAQPQSSLDLLGSLLAGADMTDAIRQPEPEPEPTAVPKKKNKRAGEVLLPCIPRSLVCISPFLRLVSVPRPDVLACSALHETSALNLQLINTSTRAEKRSRRDDEGLES